MSGGMEDANAIGRLGAELRDAAYKLADAIRAAEDGHRGLAVNVIETVNEVLEGPLGVDYRLRRAIPVTVKR